MAKKKYFWIVFAILIALLCFFRLYLLPEHTIFLSDQGRDAIIMKRILTLEHLPAIGAPSSVGQVYLGPFYYYLMAPFLGLFGMNPVGPSVGVALLSIIGILVATLIIKKEFSTTSSLLFLGVVTFSATLTEYSRFSWNPNLLPYFSFITLYFFHQWYKRSTYIDGVLFGVFFGLSIQLHYLGVLLVIPMLIFVGMKLFLRKFSLQSLYSLILAIGAFLVSISPLIIFDFRHDFLNSKQFIKLFFEGGLSSGEPYLSRLMDTTTSLTSHALALPNIPLLALVCIGLVILSFVVYTKHKNSFFLLHILTTVGYVAGFAVLGGERYPHYFGPAFLSLYVCIVGMLVVSKKNWKLFPAVAVFLTVYAYTNISRMPFLFQRGNNQIAEARQIAEFLDEHIDGRPFNFATIPDDLGEERFLYFLELEGKVPAERAKLEITDQMYVLCGKEPCDVLASPSWNITMFGEATVSETWEYDDMKLFRLNHTDKVQK